MIIIRKTIEISRRLQTDYDMYTNNKVTIANLYLRNSIHSINIGLIEILDRLPFDLHGRC